MRTSFFTNVKRIPFIKNMIDVRSGQNWSSFIKAFQKQLNEVKTELEKSLKINDRSTEYFTVLPEKSLGVDEVLRLSSIYDGLEGPAYLEGRVSGAVFNREDDDAERKMYEQVFGTFAWSNPLWPKLFPGVRVMEAEVVRMCCNLMRGDEQTCGTVNSAQPSEANFYHFRCQLEDPFLFFLPAWLTVIVFWREVRSTRKWWSPRQYTLHSSRPLRRSA